MDDDTASRKKIASINQPIKHFKAELKSINKSDWNDKKIKCLQETCETLFAEFTKYHCQLTAQKKCQPKWVLRAICVFANHIGKILTNAKNSFSQCKSNGDGLLNILDTFMSELSHEVQLIQIEIDDEDVTKEFVNNASDIINSVLEFFRNCNPAEEETLEELFYVVEPEKILLNVIEQIELCQTGCWNNLTIQPLHAVIQFLLNEMACYTAQYCVFLQKCPQYHNSVRQYIKRLKDAFNEITDKYDKDSFDAELLFCILYLFVVEIGKGAQQLQVAVREECDDVKNSVLTPVINLMKNAVQVFENCRAKYKISPKQESTSCLSNYKKNTAACQVTSIDSTKDSTPCNACSSSSPLCEDQNAQVTIERMVFGDDKFEWRVSNLDKNKEGINKIKKCFEQIEGVCVVENNAERQCAMKQILKKLIKELDDLNCPNNC